MGYLLNGKWAEGDPPAETGKTGTFERIITYFVFVMWLFYALTGVALLVLRARDPRTPRPYRVPWYPVTPLVFVLVSTAMLVAVVLQARRESLGGAVLVMLGFPAHSLWRRLQKAGTERGAT